VQNANPKLNFKYQYRLVPQICNFQPPAIFLTNDAAVKC